MPSRLLDGTQLIATSRADHPAPFGEPREDLAEAALERVDAAMQRDQRRPCGVTSLLVPDRNAVDLLTGHANRTVAARHEQPRSLWRCEVLTGATWRVLDVKRVNV
jgi:hypothetical protein